MTTKKVMVVFGTRPEAIKMAPVVQALRAHTHIKVLIVVTGQHREMLDQVLDIFNITPDLNLEVMQERQSLPDLTSRILQRLSPVIVREKPDLAVVHGDTTTALASALAAFYAGIPIAHVEAGLRSGDPLSPWPEEMNRLMVARLASIHFAPTHQALTNLVKEGVPPHQVHVTGNTVIDALLQAHSVLEAHDAIRTEIESSFLYLCPSKHLILVTGHRRENIGDGFVSICRAIACIAEREDVQIVYPVHLNPKVRSTVSSVLSGRKNIHLIEPQAYLPFVYLMSRSHLILTDSGGIQEEAPSLGKPVLVMRNNTERPEALESGVVSLVGTDERHIVDAVSRLLDDPIAYTAMSTARNPYGEGDAGQRIAEVIASD